jgi:hypothetical protein
MMGCGSASGRECETAARASKQKVSFLSGSLNLFAFQNRLFNMAKQMRKA